MCAKQVKSRTPNRTKQGAEIIAQPSADDLRPTDTTKQEVQHLLDWVKRSAKRNWVIGRPVRP